MLGVEHHCQFFRALGVLARHDGRRMRTVWDPARMLRNRTSLDATWGTEVTADIEQDFIRFHIVVHPRDLDCLRMGIEKARGKGADDIAANLKGLMNRRRLMHGAGNRLKVLRVKGKGIDI